MRLVTPPVLNIPSLVSDRGFFRNSSSVCTVFMVP